MDREAVLESMDVRIRDGLIASIAPHSDNSSTPDDDVLDATGKYLIPGLWDMHVHLSFWGEPVVEGGATWDTVADPNAYADVLPRFVAFGVTTVRDMGGSLEEIDLWHERVLRGDRLGPTIYRCGPYVDGEKPNDKYRVFVHNEQEGRDTVEQLHAQGVDFIKIHTRVTPEAFRGIASESNELGLSLSGHIPYGTRFETAVEVGMDIIDHTTSLLVSQKDDPLSNQVRDWRESYNWYRSDDGRKWVERFADQGGSLVTTLITKDGHIERKTVFGKWHVSLTKQLHDQGVNIVAGTDTARRTSDIQAGSALHDELALLVECGLSEFEALQSATVNAARMQGQLESSASVQVGKVADLVLLNSNPLDDIASTRDIHAIILRGHLLHSSDLESWRSEPAK
ncbi:MAG: amidohydrolase family protein [Phycisphaerales bacterium JB043]